MERDERRRKHRWEEAFELFEERGIAQRSITLAQAANLVAQTNLDH
jgi:hypothetical protein